MTKTDEKQPGLFDNAEIISMYMRAQAIDHQLAIVTRDKAAGHPEQSETDLVVYRAQRAPVAKAFIDAGATVQAGYALYV